MIATLLGILKIILIIILIMLLVIIVLVSLILFMPIKYKVVGGKHDNLDLSVKVSWLFGFIRGKYIINNNSSNQVIKILFIKIKENKENNNKETEDIDKQEKNKEDKIKKYDTVNIQSMDSSPKKANQKEKKDNIKSNTYKSKKNINIKKVKKKTKNKKNKSKKFKEKKESYFSKIKKVFNSENNAVIKYVLKQIIKLLKKLMPKHIKLNINFGTGDPATTGYLTGVLSISYAALGNKIKINPNFHEKELEGDFYIKGRLYLIIVVYYLIKLYSNKKVRKLIAEFS